MSHPTPFTSNLLKLPVVLTPLAWESAVQWGEPNGAGATVMRLCTLLLRVYRELHSQPGRTEIRFSFYPRAEDTADPQHIWLGLKVTKVQTPSGTGYLCVSLRAEVPPMQI
jgi:hypothetical protein